MGENGLLAPHRVGRAESKPHDGTIVTNKVNEMWGTDMTQTITVEEGRAYVFVAVEHANSEVVGIHAARSAKLRLLGRLLQRFVEFADHAGATCITTELAVECATQP